MAPSRWSEQTDVPRGDTYDARFERLAASGTDVHGEAVLVDRLLTDAGRSPGRVLDAGCGTGRVAIELARRGHAVVGTDLDEPMLATARAKAPELSWVGGDLVDLDLDRMFDVVVLAGNVMIFVAPGTEATVMDRAARHLAPGGLLVAGFQVRHGEYGPDALDRHARAAGLVLLERWSTWARLPYAPGCDYQVSVHTPTG
ncbi:class I SAM-dependent methyltransferase [soil metagenome]